LHPFWLNVNACPAIVAVPTRGLPVLLRAALSTTVPLPVPDGPDVTVSQAVLLTAVQLQPGAEASHTVVVAAATPAVTLRGDIEYEHVPACEIWKEMPATEIVPVRSNAPEFGDTVYPIVSGPGPDPPEVMTIHGAEDVALQAQPEAVVTSTVWAPPPVATDTLPGLNANMQLVPLWLTLNVSPPIVSEPVLIVLVLLAAIV
jgi:hypothetical protein